MLFCNKFKSRTDKERKDVVDKHNLCVNCLDRHSLSACNFTKSCARCVERHHSSLHDAFESADPKREEAVPCSTVHVFHGSSREHSGRLLATACVRVSDCFGAYRFARALIDPGSEASLITESLAQRLHLSRTSSSVTIVGVGGLNSGVACARVRVAVFSRFGMPVVKVSVLVLPRLTTYGHGFSCAGQSWPHINGLELADPDFLRQSSIELILGTEAFSHFILVCGRAERTSQSP